MKQALLLLSIFTGFCLSAQQITQPVYNRGAVSVVILGNKNLQLSIDSKDYSLSNAIVEGTKTTINFRNLETGQHTIQISRTSQNNFRPDNVTAIFNLRSRFDMLVKVNGNGSLELIETKKSWNGNGEVADIPVPMSNADYTILYNNIRAQRSSSMRMSQIDAAFNNTSYYFTVSQVMQLIQLVTTENTRLMLAKSSYRSVTDRNNFNQVYTLFYNESNRRALEEYVNNYDEESNPEIAMTDYDFNNLYRTIQQQRPISTQINSISSAFTNLNYYFSTSQIRQLIQLVYAESSRLQLAKQSYRAVTDPDNFEVIYNLFSNQAYRNELRDYVNNYNVDNDNGGVIITNPPMSDNNFTSLYQTIQVQRFPNEKLNSLTTVFNNTSYYFTTAQAKQLIQLVSFESNRLQLAKLSYRTITDRTNFSQLYDILSSQSSRNELDLYVKNYKD